MSYYCHAPCRINRKCEAETADNAAEDKLIFKFPQAISEDVARICSCMAVNCCRCAISAAEICKTGMVGNRVPCAKN